MIFLILTMYLEVTASRTSSQMLIMRNQDQGRVRDIAHRWEIKIAKCLIMKNLTGQADLGFFQVALQCIGERNQLAILYLMTQEKWQSTSFNKNYFTPGDEFYQILNHIMYRARPHFPLPIKHGMKVDSQTSQGPVTDKIKVTSLLYCSQKLCVRH